MKRLFIWAVCLCATLCLCACGNGKSAMTEDDSYRYDVSNSGAGWSDESAVPAAVKCNSDSTKMIYRASLELETLDFDKAQQDIAALVTDFSGYYEEQTVAGYSSGYRYAHYVIRVPAEQFAAFFAKMGGVCHTLRRDSSQENISESYYDVQSRLTTAQTKLARLQELLSRADNMADIITIEDAIADTEQTIDSLSGTLRGYEQLVDYATVQVNLDEVYRLSGTAEAPLTLGQRLSNAFISGISSLGDFLENLLVWLAYSWLWLVLLAGSAVLVVYILRRRKRKKSN